MLEVVSEAAALAKLQGLVFTIAPCKVLPEEPVIHHDRDIL